MKCDVKLFRAIFFLPYLVATTVGITKTTASQTTQVTTVSATATPGSTTTEKCSKVDIMDSQKFGEVNLNMGPLKLDEKYLNVLRQEDFSSLTLPKGILDLTFVPDSATEVDNVLIVAANVSAINVIYTDDSGKEITVSYLLFSFPAYKV